MAHTINLGKDDNDYTVPGANYTVNGEAGDDTIHGGASDDTLNGGTGFDYLHDFSGANLLSGDDADDTVVGVGVLHGDLGDDFLSDNRAGWLEDGEHAQILKTTLDGGDGNDFLQGDDLIASTLIGGAGDDTYYIYRSADTLVEHADGGYDTVYTTVDLRLADNIEAVYAFVPGDMHGFHIIGNAQDNYISGNQGDDKLEGGAGKDTLYGDDGNDTLNGGKDDDFLTGGHGNDSLDGGAGADTMYGGAGDDVYIVDSLGDVVSEQTVAGTDDGGNDRVLSSVSFTLGAFVESLTLTGSGAINGTGNDLQNNIYGNGADNVLTGNGGNDKIKGGAGNDTLIGGTGNDWLEGGTGADKFVFSAAAANGADRIQDFVHGVDKLVFATTDYSASAHFTLGAAASGSGAQFIWNDATHTLSYDHDGAGGDAAIAIALFVNGAHIDASDLLFI